MTEEKATAPPPEVGPARKLPDWVRKMALAGLLAVVVLGVVYREQTVQLLVDFIAWAQGLGPWGVGAVVAFYILACLLFLPGSIITLGAGFAFGLLWGFVAVSIGATLGAAAAFIAARKFFRTSVEGWVENRSKFQAIDRAVGRNDFKIVFLTRLSPIFPFNLLNFGFGVTKVRFRDYFLASWIGMLPGTLMYVYLGSAAQNLAQLAAGKTEGGILQNVLFGVGLVATIVVTVLITRMARRALKEEIGEDVDLEEDARWECTYCETSNPSQADQCTNCSASRERGAGPWGDHSG